MILIGVSICLPLYPTDCKDVSVVQVIHCFLTSYSLTLKIKLLSGQRTCSIFPFLCINYLIFILIFSILFASYIFTNKTLLAGVSSVKVDLSARPYAIDNFKSLLLNFLTFLWV